MESKKKKKRKWLLYCISINPSILEGLKHTTCVSLIHLVVSLQAIRSSAVFLPSPLTLRSICRPASQVNLCLPCETLCTIFIPILLFTQLFLSILSTCHLTLSILITSLIFLFIWNSTNCMPITQSDNSHSPWHSHLRFF